MTDITVDSDEYDQMYANLRGLDKACKEQALTINKLDRSLAATEYRLALIRDTLATTDRLRLRFGKTILRLINKLEGLGYDAG
jgi:hypothetical protein